jgi:hypothetical protein
MTFTMCRELLFRLEIVSERERDGGYGCIYLLPPYPSSIATSLLWKNHVKTNLPFKIKNHVKKIFLLLLLVSSCMKIMFILESSLIQVEFYLLESITSYIKLVMKCCMRFFNLIAWWMRLLHMKRQSWFILDLNKLLSLLELISMNIVLMKFVASWILGLLKLLLDLI